MLYPRSACRSCAPFCAAARAAEPGQFHSTEATRPASARSTAYVAVLFRLQPRRVVFLYWFSYRFTSRTAALVRSALRDNLGVRFRLARRPSGGAAGRAQRPTATSAKLFALAVRCLISRGDAPTPRSSTGADPLA